MSAGLRIGGGILGAYFGLTGLSVGSHWYNFKKVNSWQPPTNDKTRPLPPDSNVDRSEIEQAIIRMFHMEATPTDKDYADENIVFMDPLGSTIGKKPLVRIIYALPKIIHDHKIKDIKFTHYKNAFLFEFDQSCKSMGVTYKSLPARVYVELNDDNTKFTRVEDHWFGRPYFNGLGTGWLIRKINGKLIYGAVLRSVL